MSHTDLYGSLRKRAEAYGIAVGEKPLGGDEAGKFDGLSITINTDTDAAEQPFFLAHSIGSIVRWSLAHHESASIYAELRRAKKTRDQDPGRFEKALAGFCAFEEAASQHAVWLLGAVGRGDAVAPYTTFARADLDAILEFHRTGTAPHWSRFFARWKQRQARGEVVARPYQPQAIPPFRPSKIETQEIVQEKD